MTTDQINYLNIGLMILSAGLAFMLPFELFLFSYTVLGPLHYLTEINWLHKRKYFTNSPNDYLVLLGLCAAFFVLYVVFLFGHNEAYITFLDRTTGLSIAGWGDWIQPWTVHLVFVAFASSLIMVVVQNVRLKIILIALSTVVAMAFQEVDAYIILVGVFLPTIVHVLIFTGIFILFGALKGKSRTGYLSFGIYLICAASFFLIGFENAGYTVSDEVWANYTETKIHFLNLSLVQAIAPLHSDQQTFKKLGVMVAQLVAFAYTYHYLNWFSKTSIIKWHQISKAKLAATIGIWLLSVGIYLYNYKVGVVVLIFLSTLHVFYEFPLNYRSVFGVAEELKLRLRGA